MVTNGIIVVIAETALYYFSLVLGSFSLLALLLFASSIYLGLGNGGMERMIAYPVQLWNI